MLADQIKLNKKRTTNKTIPHNIFISYRQPERDKKIDKPQRKQNTIHFSHQTNPKYQTNQQSKREKRMKQTKHNVQFI